MPSEASLSDSNLLHCSIRNICSGRGFVNTNCCTAPIYVWNSSFLFLFQSVSKLRLDQKEAPFQWILSTAGLVFLQSQGLAVSRTIWSHFGYSQLRRSVERDVHAGAAP
jgi:hypothetical protein